MEENRKIGLSKEEIEKTKLQCEVIEYQMMVKQLTFVLFGTAFLIGFLFGYMLNYII